jgi:hypothetical protein
VQRAGGHRRERCGQCRQQPAPKPARREEEDQRKGRGKSARKPVEGSGTADCQDRARKSDARLPPAGVRG